MTNYAIKQPAGDSCIPCCATYLSATYLYTSTPVAVSNLVYPCMPTLFFNIYGFEELYSHSARPSFLSFDKCGEDDDYVTRIADEFTFTIDVWRAHQDGLWTSSTNVGVWLASTPIVPANVTITAGIGWETIAPWMIATSSCSQVTKNITTPITGSLSCPTGFVQVATITVNSNGTFSIA